MKKFREAQREIAERKWNIFCSSEAGREFVNWGLVLRCLNGEADEEEYCRLDGCYASIGPDGFKYVSPDAGPFMITGNNAIKAWRHVNR